MHAIIHPKKSDIRNRSVELAPEAAFRQPAFDCQGEDDNLKLVVFVPGVEAAGVNIEARGADLIITALKKRFVRVNWQALHLEGSQRDYRLRLRLGRAFAFEAMQAEMHNGVLTVTLPRRPSETGGGAAVRWSRVA
jgi:HSP20 family molecular chaperone IbpA